MEMIRKTLFSSFLILIVTTAATDALYYGECPTLHPFGQILYYILTKEVHKMLGSPLFFLIGIHHHF